MGFKKIGKAAIKGTKQIGKTLTAMSDSPDKRGQLGMAKAINTQHYSRENHKEKAKQSKLVEDGDLGLDTGKIV